MQPHDVVEVRLFPFYFCMYSILLDFLVLFSLLREILELFAEVFVVGVDLEVLVLFEFLRDLDCIVIFFSIVTMLEVDFEEFHFDACPLLDRCRILQ